MECDKDQLLCLIDDARRMGETEVDLSALGVPVKVSTNLYEVVVKHDQPAIHLDWDESNLTVKALPEGGAMATFQVKF